LEYYNTIYHKMGKKDYNPDEIDKVQAENERKDEMEKKEAGYRKKANKQNKINNDEELLEVKKDIIKRYGSKVVKEEHLIKKEITEISPRCCMTCYTYKIYPYEFLNAKGNDNDKSNCSKCMAEISKRVSKYKVKCVCGISFNPTDLGQSNHECSRTHINAMKQLKATKLSVVYKKPSLIKICEANDIKYYANGSVDDIFIKLKALDKIIIPKGLPEDLFEDVV